MDKYLLPSGTSRLNNTPFNCQLQTLAYILKHKKGEKSSPKKKEQLESPFDEDRIEVHGSLADAWQFVLKEASAKVVKRLCTSDEKTVTVLVIAGLINGKNNEIEEFIGVFFFFRRYNSDW